MTGAGRALPSLVLVALAVISCAKVGPPPGGPEDRDPPTIDEVFPEPGAAGVGVDSAVTLVFSENPDRRSVMKDLVVIPRVDFRESIWEEDTLRLVPKDGWARNRNTIIRIGEEARDRRGNEMKKPFQFRFTTKDVADSGKATGKVWSGREVNSRTVVFVAAFEAPADGSEPPPGDPVAITQIAENGDFRLEGLDVARAFRIVGFADRDRDLRATPPDEVVGGPPEVVTFGDSTSVQVPEFLIGTLDSLGTIAGNVEIDSSQVAIVTARRVVEESEEPLLERAVLPDGGAFSLEVPSGTRYHVGAFVDLNGDSLRGETEPHVDLEEPVSLLLTSTVSGVDFDLTGHAPPDTTGAAPADTSGAPSAPPVGTGTPSAGLPADSLDAPADTSGSEP